MKQKDIHLDVYNDKSILHYENMISEFKEGLQSPSALIRYNKIKKEQVFVKAKTGEKISPVGTSEAIEAYVVCLLSKTL